MDFLRESLLETKSRIRFLHAIGTAPDVDVYLNGSIVAKGLGFSKFSRYLSWPSGYYEVQIYPTGVYDSPLLTQKITLSPGSNYTTSIVTLENQLFLFKLRDDNIPHSNDSTFLRFINLSPNAPLLSLAMSNDKELFNDVEYLETTGYYPLSAGIYDLELLFSIFSINEYMPKNIRNIALSPNNFYTIYIIGLFNSTPPLGYLSVEDMK